MGFFLTCWREVEKKRNKNRTAFSSGGEVFYKME
jgi:hypothetical protein